MKNVLVVILGIICCSCTYRGTLDANFYHKASNYNDKINKKIYLLYDNGLDSYMYNAGYEIHTLHYSCSPGLKNAIVEAISAVYNDVKVFDNYNKKNYPDADLIIIPETSITNGSINLNMIVKDFKNNKIIKTYSSSNSIRVVTPSSYHVYGFLGIFTGCAFCPITIPAQNSALGEANKKMLEGQLSNAINTIIRDMSTDNI